MLDEKLLEVLNKRLSQARYKGRKVLVDGKLYEYDEDKGWLCLGEYNTEGSTFYIDKEKLEEYLGESD